MNNKIKKFIKELGFKVIPSDIERDDLFVNFYGSKRRTGDFWRSGGVVERLDRVILKMKFEGKL